MSSPHTIEVVEETGSTNADLLIRLNRNESIPEGYWLRAKRQIRGRGRLGRKWESLGGNLYCSTAVNLRASDPAAHSLAFVAGLAVMETLKRSLYQTTPVFLKWPNDALVGNAKIAGILLERANDSVVVGIGINVGFAPEVSGRETTCITYENGKHSGNCDLVLSILAEELAAQLVRWRSEPLAQILDAWTTAAHPIGTPLRAGDGEDTVTGSFAGLDGDGGLLLRLANGAIRTIHAGDVSMIAQGDT